VTEPTAEHWDEANRIAPLDCPNGAITRIAHALAAAEARGFERGRAAGPAPYVDPLADEQGNRHHLSGSRCVDPYCRRAHAIPQRHLEPR
jgi:hypothetical protein